MTQSADNIKPRSMSKSELAGEYNICVETLNNWWKRAGIEIPANVRTLTPAQVSETYEKCGEP